jgi:hypothetical protein
LDTSNLNIYPLNEQNLQALLDYYFPFLPAGNVHQLLIELRGTGLTLKELEYASEKILPFIPFINEKLKGTASQTNILDYSVEVFLMQDNDFFYLSPERIEIIKLIKTKTAPDQSYEEMPGKESHLFFYNNWN